MVQAVQLSALEELALEGVMALPRVKASALLAGETREAKRLQELTKDAPHITGEYVDYILFGKNSVAQRSGNAVWPLSYDAVELTIALLNMLGKTPEQISDMLVASFSTEPTNSGKVKKYSASISGENRLRLKGNHPAIHRAVWERLPNSITPNVIVDAVTEFREQELEYIWDPEYHFSKLKRYFDGLTSGKLKKDLVERYFGERNRPLSFESYKFAEKMNWLSQSISEIYEHHGGYYELADRVRSCVVQPLETVLQDFMEELGIPRFENAGYSVYSGPHGAIYNLRHDVKHMEEKVRNDFRPLVEEIRKDVEREFRKQAIFGFLARY